jgi:hypothetical protein
VVGMFACMHAVLSVLAIPKFKCFKTVCVPCSMYRVVLGNDEVPAQVESAVLQALTPCASKECHTLCL